MLIQLKIQNLILVEHAEIYFDAGLNIITGETGAGKSALLSAIRQITGERADANLIGKNGDMAIVEAVLSTYTLPRDLEAPSRGEPLIIRREIHKSGKSRCFANDQQITLNTLRQIVGSTIELVDQSSSSSLSSTEEQRYLLDTFAGTKNDIEKLSVSYSEEQDLQKRKECLLNASETRARDLKWAEEDLQFIEEVNWQANEEETLISTHYRLTHAQELLEKMDTLSQLLADSSIGKAVAILERSATLDQTLTALAMQLKNAKFEIDEVASSLNSYMTRLDANPLELTKLEERMANIEQVKRRFGKTFDQVETKKEELLQKIESLNNLDKELKDIHDQLLAKTRENQKLAKTIQEKRKKQAPAFTAAILKELQSLNLPYAQLHIDFQEIPLASHGIDAICFLFSANAGHAPIPMSECASGGELSRLLFSIKVVLTSKAQNACLVFDEIDSNVGGQTASILGEKLARIASDRQVICVTHFVQVARLAGSHFGVSKNENIGKTITKIAKLTQKEKEHEYQRMLGYSCS